MLKRTNDRKVTNSVTAKGNSNIANSFSLPAGKEFSCPNATAYCEKICYAGKLEKIYKGFKATVMHNWELLNNATYNEMHKLLSDMIAEFRSECDKRDAKKLFRIHADGDYFSSMYTMAWIEVIRDNPDIHFWSYTRNPEAARLIKNAILDNHALMVSIDRDNASELMPLANDYNIPMAIVDDTFADVNNLAGTKVFRCPSNAGNLPLITDKGSACVRCSICVVGRKSVAFAKLKR